MRKNKQKTGNLNLPLQKPSKTKMVFSKIKTGKSFCPFLTEKGVFGGKANSLIWKDFDWLA